MLPFYVFNNMHPVEEDLKEVCLIDTILDEQSQLQQLLEDLIEKPKEIFEELQEALDLCVVYGPWRRKEEILPLLIREDSKKEESTEHQKLDLKPLPVELKYAYLEEGEQCPVVIFALLNA